MKRTEMKRTGFKQKPQKPMKRTGFQQQTTKPTPAERTSGTPLKRTGLQQQSTKPKPVRAPKPVPGNADGLNHQHSSGNPTDSKLGPKPKKRIRQQGKRTLQWKAFRKHFAPVLLEQQGPTCAWPGCHNEWTDVHHLIGRAGESAPYVLDHTMMVGLCNPDNLSAETTEGPKNGMRFRAHQLEAAREATAKARGMTVSELAESYTPPDLTQIG